MAVKWLTVLIVALWTSAGYGRVLHVSPAVLSGAEYALQFRTISQALAGANPGDTVLIYGGVYRETVVVDRGGTAEQPVRIQPVTGHRVILTGADRLTTWHAEDRDRGIYSADWPHRFLEWSPTGTHPDDDYHALIGRCEQVFVQGLPLRQVLEAGQLAPGAFWVDQDKQRLYAWPADGADLTNDEVIAEASVRPSVLEVTVPYVHVKGLTIRYAANHAQFGAAQFKADHITVDDCTFERTNSVGASFSGSHISVNRSRFLDNGQLGFGAANAHHLAISESLSRGNNAKNFNRMWEAGGNKIVLSRNVVIERSRFESNYGPGVWFDIGNEDCVVRECYIADNDEAGLFYEISYGLVATDNVIVGNGFARTPGSWGAAAGIVLSSSEGCLVERNLLIGNREGFNFREQTRVTPTIEDTTEKPIRNRNHVVRHNLIGGNADIQSAGWFDMEDNQHWPPQLKGLNIDMHENVYAPAPGQKLFMWGASWRKTMSFADLNRLEFELEIEPGSVVEPLQLIDPASGDYRVPADSQAAQRGAFPRGGVDGILVGID